MSRGEKERYPHIWSHGGAPANSPQTLPARLPASLAFGWGPASPWSRTAPQSAGSCEGAWAEGGAQGDPDNSLGEGAMPPPREGKVVIAAMLLISSKRSAAAGS